ncbi:alpha/beta hydrolase [Microbacterium elymi]|uniref:Alpha/beta hydrolase n=1 Tax=Microbacterium elymi TaxID=2909587 RepID=A0ABY5NLU7_9MICO|nr:alpha/beta hydrolase [Microbacterium elymi]UUT36162.1 alpha/beta hydrolase [Microbacterium elymi]
MTDTAHAEAQRVLRDLVFAEPVGYRPLSLDLHLGADRAPLIVFVHGGGFRLGSRRMFCPTMTADDPFARIVDAGFAVASVDYRLSAEATFPAQLDDVFDAVQWLCAHADEFGFDASRVVLWGESAGATLAALVGLRPDAGVRGVVDWYGPADIVAMATELGQLSDPETREAGWLGGTVDSDLAVAAQASPVTHVHADAPPFLIAHGQDDQAVPLSQSRLFAAALTQAGASADLELVAGAGHMWQGDDVDRRGLLERAIAFARRCTD